MPLQTSHILALCVYFNFLLWRTIFALPSPSYPLRFTVDATYNTTLSIQPSNNNLQCTLTVLRNQAFDLFDDEYSSILFTLQIARLVQPPDPTQTGAPVSLKLNLTWDPEANITYPYLIVGSVALPPPLRITPDSLAPNRCDALSILVSTRQLYSSSSGGISTLLLSRDLPDQAPVVWINSIDSVTSNSFSITYQTTSSSGGLTCYPSLLELELSTPSSTSNYYAILTTNFTSNLQINTPNTGKDAKLRIRSCFTFAFDTSRLARATQVAAMDDKEIPKQSCSDWSPFQFIQKDPDPVPDPNPVPDPDSGALGLFDWSSLFRGHAHSAPLGRILRRRRQSDASATNENQSVNSTIEPKAITSKKSEDTTESNTSDSTNPNLNPTAMATANLSTLTTIANLHTNGTSSSSLATYSSSRSSRATSVPATVQSSAHLNQTAPTSQQSDSTGPSAFNNSSSSLHSSTYTSISTSNSTSRNSSSILVPSSSNTTSYSNISQPWPDSNMSLLSNQSQMTIDYTTTSIVTPNANLFNDEINNTSDANTTSTSSITTNTSLLASPPQFVSLSAINSSALILSWLVPNITGTGGIQGYTVCWRNNASASNTSSCANTTSTSTSFVISGLESCVSYAAIVTAINTGGFGSSSNPITNTTQTSVPGAPHSLSLTSLNSSALNFTWVPPAFLACPLNNYTVCWRDASSASNNSNCATTDSATTSILITQLESCVNYLVNVTAVSDAGHGQSSNISNISTPANVPGAPQSPLLSSLNASALNFTWMPPTYPACLVRNYIVCWREASSTLYASNCSNTSSTFYVITGLESCFYYLVNVTAVNDAGHGQSSTMSNISTLAIAPSQPQSLSLIPIHSSSLNFTWQRPKSPACEILDYKVCWPVDNYTNRTSICNITHNTYFEIKGLRSCTNYSANVTARNEAGYGQMANVINSTPPVAPLAPRNPNISSISDSVINLLWQAPDHSYCQILAYRVCWSGDNFARRISNCTNTSDTSYAITGLESCVTYLTNVSAINSLGPGPPMDFVNATTDSISSGPPLSPTLIALNYSALKIFWLPPIYPTCEIHHYIVCWSKNSSESNDISCITTISTSYVIEGLLSCTSYSANVTAVNAKGVGESSNITTTWTLPHVFALPTELTLKSEDHETWHVKYSVTISNLDKDTCPLYLHTQLNSTYGAGFFWSQNFSISSETLQIDKSVQGFLQLGFSVSVCTDFNNRTTCSTPLTIFNNSTQIVPAEPSSFSLKSPDSFNASSVTSISASFEVKAPSGKWKLSQFQITATCTRRYSDLSTFNSMYETYEYKADCCNTYVAFAGLPPGCLCNFDLKFSGPTGIYGPSRSISTETPLVVLPDPKVEASSLFKKADKKQLESSSKMLALWVSRSLFPKNCSEILYVFVIVSNNSSKPLEESGLIGDINKDLGDYKSPPVESYIAKNYTFNQFCTGHCAPDSDIKNIIIGDESCNSGRVCNGPLQSETTFKISLRVATKYGFSTFHTLATTEASSIFYFILIPVLVIVLVMILVAAFLLYYNRARLQLLFLPGAKNGSDSANLQQPPYTRGGSQNGGSRRAHSQPPSMHEPMDSATVPLTSIPLAAFADHVAKLKRDCKHGFSIEYEEINSKSPRKDYFEAELVDNRPKNRFIDILPFDENRVVLVPIADGEGDYINASLIPPSNLTGANISGALKPCNPEYIAAQGPLPITMDDFWRMVWQSNVRVIVMLTLPVEKGRLKCEVYWPDLNEQRFYGDISVYSEQEITYPNYVLRDFQLSQGIVNETRTVTQMHFISWPDKGCPTLVNGETDTNIMLDFIRSVRQQIPPEDSAPLLVHCSAGVGRTGTFIALDRLMQQVELGASSISVFDTVLELRHARRLMVQTEDQYVYLYDCLEQVINEKFQGQPISNPAAFDPMADDHHIYQNLPSNFIPMTLLTSEKSSESPCATSTFTPEKSNDKYGDYMHPNDIQRISTSPLIPFDTEPEDPLSILSFPSLPAAANGSAFYNSQISEREDARPISNGAANSTSGKSTPRLETRGTPTDHVNPMFQLQNQAQPPNYIAPDLPQNHTKNARQVYNSDTSPLSGSRGRLSAEEPLLPLESSSGSKRASRSQTDLTEVGLEDGTGATQFNRSGSSDLLTNSRQAIAESQPHNNGSSAYGSSREETNF